MVPLRAGSKQLIREINQTLVLNATRTHGPLSRTDIAALVRLSLPTISGITAELLEADLIRETDVGTSTGGRPPILLTLNPGAGYVVGVKLTETTAIAALTDLEGTVVDQHHEPLANGAPATVVAAIARAVAQLRRTIPAKPLFGVGVGLAGVVDRDQGTIRYATYFGWRDLAFGDHLAQQLGVPVVLDNDVNALTAAAQWYGAGRGIAHFVVVSLGRGVGMGAVLNGTLYRGASGGAGEFGHTIVLPDGPLCSCGQRGCLEAMVSDGALQHHASAVLERPVSITDAVDGALHGNLALQAIFTTAGQTLGRAVANLVNVLNPALIIVGGEGTHAGALILDPFCATLREYCFNGFFDDLQIIMEPWGDDAWARGAASLLLNDLFNPMLTHVDAGRPMLSLHQGMRV